MDPDNGPGISSSYSDISMSGNSRNHLGNNYHINVHPVEQLTVSTGRDERMKAIIEHLRYPEIYHRVEQIHEAAEDSYEWAFDAWSGPLQSWLTKGHDIFWVSGKSGSGKSTFMKFLSRRSETKNSLQDWADSKSLMLAAHFFWYASTKSSLERNREGLYRSLLYQILKLRPELLPVLFSDRWNSYQKPPYSQDEWTVKELLDGLKNLGNVPETAFALFVDALDECYPPTEHSMLLDELEAICILNNVKICASSRSWKPFEPRFRSLATRIIMQELTRNDIERFISAELLKAGRDSGIRFEGQQGYDNPSNKPRSHISLPCGVPQRAEEFIGDNSPLVARKNHISPESVFNGDSRSISASADFNELVKNISDKAEGVFLWVHLIMRDLQDEIFAGKQIRELHSVVNDTPSSLIGYYKLSIWKRIGWRRARQVAMAFKIATVLASFSPHRWYPGHVKSVIPFWYLRHDKRLEDPHFVENVPIVTVSREECGRMLKQTEAFLGEVCKDLISVQNTDPSPTEPIHVHLEEIKFLHRTVLNFLNDEETQRWIDERVPDHFRAPQFMAELALLRLKHRSGPYDPSHSLMELMLTVNCVTVLPSERILGTLNEGICIAGSLKGMSNLGHDIVRQYEDLAVHHLRALSFDQLFWRIRGLSDFSKSVIQIARCFVSCGLDKFVQELTIRYPSMCFPSGSPAAVLSLVRHLLSAPFDEYRMVHLMEILFARGILCTDQLWHSLLYIWCTSENEAIQARIWPVAKLFLASGVILDRELCLVHFPKYEDPSGRSCRFSTGNSCLLKTAGDMLAGLVPREHRSEAFALLCKYRCPSWLRETNQQRWRKYSTLCRYGRSALLASAKQSRVFISWRTFELQYAKWVYLHERERMAGYAYGDNGQMSAYCHPAPANTCRKCGVDILLKGCLRWICLSCLEDYYCTFCVPSVRDDHAGEFICIDTCCFPKRSQFEEAIQQLGEVFECAIREHESIRHLEYDEAKALALSIAEINTTFGRDRKWEYLSDQSIRCSANRE